MRSLLNCLLFSLSCVQLVAYGTYEKVELGRKKEDKLHDALLGESFRLIDRLSSLSLGGHLTRLGVYFIGLLAHGSRFHLFWSTAPSFVPRSHGVISPMPKNVVASRIYGGTSVANRRNDIKMMPIGVPKVAYRVPGSQSADW